MIEWDRITDKRTDPCFRKKIKKIYLYFMQLFSEDAIGFSKKKFFDPKNVKKLASKVAHNQPRPFYFTVHPRPQPTAQN